MHRRHPSTRYLSRLLPALWSLALLGCGGALANRSPAADLVAIVRPLEVQPAPRTTHDEVEAGWIAAVHDAIHGARVIDLVRSELRAAGAAGGPAPEVRLEVLVEADGRIEDVILQASHAGDLLGDRARSIFTRLAALPAPPPALHSDDGLTRLHWRLARDQRGCGEADARVVRVLDSPDEAIARLVRTGRQAEASARLLGEIDHGALPETQARRLAREVLSVAADTDADPAARTTAIFALARAGDRRVVPALRRMLRSAAREAACAAGLLAELRAREAIPDLEAALRRNEPTTNVALALALKALGNPEAATALLPALRAPDAATRLAALRAMAAAPSTTQTGGVVALLADPVPAVRLRALHVLGLIGGRAAAASLVRHAAHPSAHERAAALRALGASRLPGPAARWAAEAALNDSSREVRAAAAAALAHPAVEQRQAPRAGLASGAQPPASRAAPERGADRTAARIALVELAAARGPQRLLLAARQLPVRHACTVPAAPATPATPPSDCARLDRPAPPCAPPAASGHAAVALVSGD